MQKIINYFRKKYFQKKYSAVDLTREQLKGISIDFLVKKNNTIESDFEPKKQKELYQKATLMKKEFDMIANYLINLQGNFAVKEARNQEQLLFTRGTINGIILMKEEVERLSNLFEEQKKKKEVFDKHSLYN